MSSSPPGDDKSSLLEDELRLRVPADPDYARVARTAVAGLALRLGFSYAAVEELRLAIDETLILLLHPAGDDAAVTFRFSPAAEGLSIQASTSAPGEGPWPDPEARHRFEELVSPIVDRAEIDEPAHRVELLKRFRTE